MKGTALLTLLVNSVVLVECSPERVRYGSQEVHILSVEVDSTGTTLSYLPILETMFFCPGVDTSTFDTGQSIGVTFVRCGSSESCLCDYKAEIVPRAALGNDSIARMMCRVRLPFRNISVQ